jgi:hypothetical protein
VESIWIVLLVLGIAIPAIILFATTGYVLVLARRIRTLDPAATAPWRLVLLHLAIVTGVQFLLTPFGAAAGTGLGAVAAMAILPIRLYRRLRDTLDDGPDLPGPSTPDRLPEPLPAIRARALAALFAVTAVALPWSVGVGVKLWLDAHGQPTLPYSAFLGLSQMPGLLILTLTAWGFPFLALSLVLLMPRFGTGGPWSYGRRLPVWLAYGAGVVAGIPVFIGMFREFDAMYLILPVGSYLAVPMAVAYALGVALGRRGGLRPVRARSGQ